MNFEIGLIWDAFLQRDATDLRKFTIGRYDRVVDRFVVFLNLGTEFLDDGDLVADELLEAGLWVLVLDDVPFERCRNDGWGRVEFPVGVSEGGGAWEQGVCVVFLMRAYNPKTRGSLKNGCPNFRNPRNSPAQKPSNVLE